MSIIGIVQQYRLDIQEIQEKIKTIQEGCSHPKEAVTKKAESSTGHWCEQDDWYKYRFHCQLCEKRWSIDQDEYRKIGRPHG